MCRYVLWLGMSISLWACALKGPLCTLCKMYYSFMLHLLLHLLHLVPTWRHCLSSFSATIFCFFKIFMLSLSITHFFLFCCWWLFFFFHIIKVHRAWPFSFIGRSTLMKYSVLTSNSERSSSGVILCVPSDCINVKGRLSDRSFYSLYSLSMVFSLFLWLLLQCLSLSFSNV